MRIAVLAVVLAVAAAAALHAFRTQARQSASLRDLVAWLKAERAPEWGAIPRWTQTMLVSGVERIRRSPLGSDPEFRHRYQQYREQRRAHVLALILLAAAAVLIWVSGSVFDLP